MEVLVITITTRIPFFYKTNTEMNSVLRISLQRKSMDILLINTNTVKKLSFIN